MLNHLLRRFKAYVHRKRRSPSCLRDGLLFDDGFLLPWDSTVGELKALGKPKIDDYFVVWDDLSVFNGLPVYVTAQGGGHKNCDMVIDTFWVDVIDKSRWESAEDFYRYLLDYLTTLFGEPQESLIVQGYPWDRWFWKDVFIGIRIYERFSFEKVTFIVSNDEPI